MSRLMIGTICLSLLTATACGVPRDDNDEMPIVVTTDGDAGSNGSSGEESDAALPSDAGTDPDLDQGSDVEPDAMTAPDVQSPDMPDEQSGTVCQTKEAPVQLINTCTFEWSSCSDGVDHTFECNIQNVGGMRFSLCNCFEDGVMDPADKIVDICGLGEWAEIEAVVNEECGWDLR